MHFKTITKNLEYTWASRLEFPSSFSAEARKYDEFMGHCVFYGILRYYTKQIKWKHDKK